MKKFLATLALGLSLGLGVFGTASVATAQTAPAAAVAAPAADAKPADAAAPVAAATAAPAAAEAAPVLVPNKGDTAWMMVSTILVILMVLPGLALFYGGLVRSKNMLSVLMQVMVTFSLIVVLWFIYGYSLAFTEGSAFIGGFDRLFMKGIWDNAAGTFANAATFSKGVVIPEVVFAAFQATFAGITCALIVGAFAERIKFSAVMLFMVLWFTFSYLPIAHMVWFWMGPDAYASKEVADAMTGKAGQIWQWGALDAAHTIVCAHGLSRQGRDFDVLAQALLARSVQPLRVVCPDVAGRGQSDWLKDPQGYQLPSYAADMLALLAHLKPATLDWLGTSMGGLIGMGLAALQTGAYVPQPDETVCLILCGANLDPASLNAAPAPSFP
eukprot:gene14410-30682_t